LPSSQHCVFATAGRDKLVKVWQLEGAAFVYKITISRQLPITSIAFTCDKEQRLTCLAIGEENGQISIHVLDVATLKLVTSMDIDMAICPSKTVTRLAWRPQSTENAAADCSQLAIASADSSVRVTRVRWESACKHDGSGDFGGL
jgi:elongator complex protein 2